MIWSHVLSQRGAFGGGFIKCSAGSDPPCLCPNISNPASLTSPRHLQRKRTGSSHLNLISSKYVIRAVHLGSLFLPFKSWKALWTRGRKKGLIQLWVLKNSSHLSSAVQGPRGLHSPFDGPEGSQKFVQSSQGCLIITISLLCVPRIFVSPQYNLLAFFCQGGTPQQWAAAHLSTPPGSGVLPFPDIIVWRHILYGGCFHAMLCTKRGMSAIYPWSFSTYDKVQKRLDIFRDSKITQNIISNVNVFQAVCPTPASGEDDFGIHRQLVVWRKILNISASLLKFMQINSSLKVWKCCNGGRRQRGRTGGHHAEDVILKKFSRQCKWPRRFSTLLQYFHKSILPVGQHSVNFCVSRCWVRAWRLLRQNTRGWGQRICGSSRHLSMDFRAQTHDLLPIRRRAQREGRGYSVWAHRCLLLESTGGWSGHSGLCGSSGRSDHLLVVLRWPLAQHLHQHWFVLDSPWVPNKLGRSEHAWF